jgi:hypothetical protein
LVLPLSVIGAGMPRTGTLSLKIALEQLGFGPCHHMTELFTHPHLVPLWEQAFDGTLGDFEEIFKDYNATTDQPAAPLWDKLAARYPDAKIVLTLRDPEKWYASMMATIYAERSPTEVASVVPFMQMARKMTAYEARSLGFAPPPGDPPEFKPAPREEMLAKFHANTERVKRLAPPDRLLIFEVAQGWEPLCHFLGKPIPATPFPRVNDTEQFRAMMAALPQNAAP